MLEGDSFRCDDLSEEQHETKRKVTWKFGAYEYTGCPGCLLKEPEMITMLNFYSDYKLMGLPFADLGWGDSPAWMIDVIRIIEIEKIIIRNTTEGQ